MYGVLQIKESADKAVIYAKPSAPKKAGTQLPKTAPAQTDTTSRMTQIPKQKGLIPPTENYPRRNQLLGVHFMKLMQIFVFKFLFCSFAVAKKTKPVKVDRMEDSNDIATENDNDGMEDYQANNDNVTRVDISAQITESLLAELADENWKVRCEMVALNFESIAMGLNLTYHYRNDL